MIKSSAIMALLLALGMTAAQQEPQCGSCQIANDASCESETSYYNCFDGRKYGVLVQCQADTVCSNASNICVEKPQLTSGIVNVCGTGGTGENCNTCTQNKKYTCVSKRQAGRCINNKVSSVVNCGADQICVVNAGNEDLSVCMPQCAADFMKRNATCSNDEYVGTTPTPPTTPSQGERENICRAGSGNITTLFFYTYNDESCQTAVYCQRNSLTSNDWVTLFRTCPASTPYFDTRLRSCVTAKPASCSINTTTTTITSTSDITTGSTSESIADSTSGFTTVPTSASTP